MCKGAREQERVTNGLAGTQKGKRSEDGEDDVEDDKEVLAAGEIDELDHGFDNKEGDGGELKINVDLQDQDIHLEDTIHG